MRKIGLRSGILYFFSLFFLLAASKTEQVPTMAGCILIAVVLGSCAYLLQTRGGVKSAKEKEAAKNSFDSKDIYKSIRSKNNMSGGSSSKGKRR